MLIFKKSILKINTPKNKFYAEILTKATAVIKKSNY